MSAPSPPTDDCPLLISLRTYLYQIAQQAVTDQLRPQASESDFVQQALLDAHQKRDQFRGSSPEEYRGWVRAILVNRIRNFHRDHSASAGGPGCALRLDEAAVPSSADDTPLAVLLDEERFRRLARALTALPAEHREVLAHRFEHDRTFAEIGALMSRSEDAARMLLHRALDDLRWLLRPLHD